VASQVGGFTDEVTTAVSCAIGQTIGKVGTVLAIRRGGRSRLARRLKERRERPRKPAGRVRTQLRACRTGCWDCWVDAGREFPPTRMSVIPFGVAVLLGRLVLFLAVAFGVSALVH
jgi:hypothetical protein